MALAIHRQLDLKGLASPLALAQLSRAIADMGPGELVEIIASDPALVRDIDRWARWTAHDLLESSQFGNVFRFVVRRR